MSTPRLRVYVHIGPPKTATTYLQAVVDQNVSRLRSAGVTLVGGTIKGHFFGAIDLRGVHFGGFDNPRVPGSWAKLVAGATSATTPKALITHEMYAGADDEHIARLVADLAPAEVHVIYGMRDLGRQLPAFWQESLKNRGTHAYPRFLKTTLDGDQNAQFWKAQDIPGTLGRWARHVPAERIHAMTIPQSGSDPSTTWRRFCECLDISPEGYDLDVSRTNTSLSMEHAEVLRALNREFPKDTPWPVYERGIKRFYNQIADTGAEGQRIVVPEVRRDLVRSRAHQDIEYLRSSGHHLVGDLDDLVPADKSFGPRPDVPPADALAVAARLLGSLILQEQDTRRAADRRHAAASKRTAATRAVAKKASVAKKAVPAAAQQPVARQGRRLAMKVARELRRRGARGAR